MPSLILRPGMFIRLKQQPWDLPDFILEKYRGDMCWIRQQAWGPHVCLRIKITQIAIPNPPVSCPVLDVPPRSEGYPHPWRGLPPQIQFPIPWETQYSKEKTYPRKRL
jgi:hypothetical protein